MQSRPSPASNSADRTTTMLLIILIIYLISVTGFAIFLFLVVFLGENFLLNVVQPIWEVFEFSLMMNACTNFVLLVLMSEKFRQTYSRIFCSPAQTYLRNMSTSQKTTSETEAQSSVARQRKSSLFSLVKFRSRVTGTMESDAYLI